MIKTGLRFGILMVDLYEKVSSYMTLGYSDQKLVFIDGTESHFELGPQAEIARIFGRGLNLF